MEKQQKIKVNQKENFLNGIIKENPILVSMLGLCPTLAITVTLENALGMGLAFAFVLLMSNIVVSLIRKIVPNEIRIPVYIVVIATFVTIVEMLLNAFLPALSKSLGLFVSLIVVNCIVLGRAEAFASKNNVLSSAIDAIGVSIGYTIVLALISIIREVLGSGTITVWGDLVLNINSLFGSEESLPVFSTFFVSPAGAYFVLGILFAVVAAIQNSKKRKKEDVK